MFHIVMAIIFIATGQTGIAAYAPDGQHEKLYGSKAVCEAALPAIEAEAHQMLKARGLTKGTDYEFQLVCDHADGNPA